MPWWDAIGAIIVVLVLSKICNIDATIYTYGWAILFSWLLEVDLLIWLIKNNFKVNKWIHQHRDLLHYPILYLPIGSLSIWCFVNQFYALLFLLCSFFHFGHDSIGIGWGIKWLFPFSRNNYKFFTQRNINEKRHFLASWDPDELKNEIEKRGDKWYKWYYLLI